MNILKCDSCGKPLGEGAFARGDAVRRDHLVVCRTCTAMEQRGHQLPISPPPGREAAWLGNPETPSEELITEPIEECGPACSKPSQEMFDQGSALRAPDGSVWIRVDEGGDRKSQPSATPFPATDARPALPEANGRAAAAMRAKTLPQRTSGRRQNILIAQEQTDTRRSPYLISATLLMLIVLPAFAFSLYTSISTQAELNRIRDGVAAGGGGGSDRATVRRDDDRPLVRDKGDDSATDPHDTAENKDETSTGLAQSDPSPLALPPAARRNLNRMEAGIARPLVARLESPDAGERILALIEVVRLRAVAALPAVRALAHSADPVERQFAIAALGELLDRDALDDLKRYAASDDSPEVRLAAQRAIGRITGHPESLDISGFTIDELKRLEAELMEIPDGDAALEYVRKAIKSWEEQRNG